MSYSRLCLMIFLLVHVFESGSPAADVKKSNMTHSKQEVEESDDNHYGTVDPSINRYLYESKRLRNGHGGVTQKSKIIDDKDYKKGKKADSQLRITFQSLPTSAEGPQEKLDEITAKIWRAPACMEIQQAWVHPFCLRYTAIGAEFQKTWDTCQFLGVDWGCVYTTLGIQGGGFSMSMLASLMGRVADNELRRGLLAGLDKCEKYWRIYRYEEARRILAHEVQREVEHKTYNGQPSFIIGRPLRSINYNRLRAIRLKKFRDTEKRRKQDREEIAKIHQRIFELQNKDYLNEEEKEELLQLLQPDATSTPKYSMIGMNVQREEQIEMAYKNELGQCIAQEVVLACEPKVRSIISKLF